MKLRSDKILYYADSDTLESDNGQEYRIERIEYDTGGSISVYLSGPVKIRAFISGGDNLYYEDADECIHDLVDNNIIDYLIEVQRTLPPMQNIRDHLV